MEKYFVYQGIENRFGSFHFASPIEVKDVETGFDLCEEALDDDDEMINWNPSVDISQKGSPIQNIILGIVMPADDGRHGAFAILKVTATGSGFPLPTEFELVKPVIH